MRGMSVKHGVGLFHTLIWTLVPLRAIQEPIRLKSAAALMAY